MSAVVDRIKADALAGAAYYGKPQPFAHISDLFGEFGQIVQRAAAQAAATGRGVEIAPGVTVRVIPALASEPPALPSKKKPANAGQKRGGLPKEI